MGSKEIWPPLEDVREWAAAKIHDGQIAPAATGKMKHLVALIDEILAAQAQSVAPEEVEREPEREPQKSLSVGS